MNQDEPVSRDGLRAIIERADDYLENGDFSAAERIANEALSPPHLRQLNDDEPFDGIALISNARAHCIIGACCLATRRADEARAHFEEAVALGKAAADPALQASGLNGIAILERNDPPTATKIAEEALQLAERADDKREQAKALNTLGTLQVDGSDFSSAINFYSIARQRAEEAGDTRSLVAALGNLANAYRFIGHYSEALECLNKALPLTQRTADRSIVQRILHLIGEIHSSRGDHIEALNFLGKSLELAEELNDNRSLATINISKGIVHSAIADFSRALDLYDRALKIAEETNDRYTLATCLDNIGTVYWSLNDFARALDYFTRALAIAEEIGIRSLVANALGNIGIVYNDVGEHARAFEYLNRALRLSDEMGDKNQIAHWMFGIASAQFKLRDLATAQNGFLETLAYRRETLGTTDGVAETLLALGLVLREMQRPDEALPYLLEAQEVAERSNEKKFNAEAHKEVANIYWLLGDSRLAFEHITRFHALDKEVFSEESQKRIELFHIRAAVADKEREAELHRLRADRSEQDLASNIVQLLAQNELLSQVRDDLSSIVRRIATNPESHRESWEQALRELRDKLKELPSKSVDWPKLEMQFTSVHPNFKTMLLNKFPTLTKQELKMCILARLGIKTVDVARLLCLSERTIDSHRLSLRKKIGLTKNQSLTAYLAELEQG